MNCRKITECKELAAANKRVKELAEENRILKYDLAEMRNKWFSRKSRKREEKTEAEELQSKKRGAPIGHPGWFRKRPAQIDKVKELYPEICPECGSHNVKNCEGKTEEHIQEDIVIPRVKATKYVHHYGYCKDCHNVFCPKGEDELLRAYIGPTAKAFAVYLKYDIKVSDRDIQRLFGKMFQLKVDPSSIPGFRNQLTRAGYPLYEDLLKELRKSSVVNADETGWSLDGENHWLWNFSTPKLSLTHIDPSRGQKVVERILGEKFDGILVSDFLGAYDKIEARAKQKCIIHLNRDLKKAEECYGEDNLIQGYCGRLKDLFDRAIELKDAWLENDISGEPFGKKREGLVAELKDFHYPNPQKGILQTISKRLIKHKDHLFTFLYHKDVPSHNNHAEQQIRPHVLLRKITFCNRSLKGIMNHSVLSSIVQTCNLNQQDPLKMLKRVLLADKAEKEQLLYFIRSP